jgi:hypothetical protein
LAHRDGGDDVVQRHDDVGADAVLDLDGVLGRQQHPLAVHRRLKVDPFLCDVRQVQQRHLHDTCLASQSRALVLALVQVLWGCRGGVVVLSLLLFWWRSVPLA